MSEEINPSNFFKSRTNIAVIAFFFVGIFVLALGAGLFAFKGAKNNSSSDIQIISASEVPVHTEIVVDVAGAVVTPGVYKLAQESRVFDAIKAAGGLNEDADRTRINLAAKVVDGQKINVPAIGEQLGSSIVGSSVAGQSISGLVSINSGSQAELESLPGIGPVTAVKIISSRPYSTLEDLKTKKAVGSATYDKIKDLITL